MTSPLSFQENVATADQIIAHLKACDSAFHPPLSQRVNLSDYARKLQKRSLTFEAWDDLRLVGLVAAYLDCNDQNDLGFVSNVSVDPAYTGRGLATSLLEACHGRAIERGVRKLELEVGITSIAAVSLYRKLGYAAVREHENMLSMVCICGEDE